MNVGDKIRQRRISLNMTQEELARKVGYKSRASINNIELKRDIPMKKLKPIADALEISVYDLMGWTSENSKYAHIKTDDVVDWMLDSYNQELIHMVNKLNPAQKEELWHYAEFLINKNKRED